MTQSTSINYQPSFRVYLGSSLLLLGIIMSTLLFGPIILACVVLPFSIRYKVAGIWINLLLWMVEKSCGIRYEVEGLDHIQGIDAAVVLSKHQSAWETVALRKILPPQTAVLKESLLWLPIWGWALATLKPIAIDRNNQREALKILIDKGTKCLKEGLWVVVFPEGTRAAPGEKKKFNAGGAILAQKSGYPVIPVAHNAGEYWPRYSFLKYPGVVQVRIGPPIEIQNRKAGDINAEAEAWIEQAMTEITHLPQTPATHYQVIE
ncbi:lysophospholipid acyltransferase family protein [Methylotuvimicrobium alcaliphilum]|uniref:Phospholipid/glycerol acyltransferase n=1 Tax=Methylotuvimicrobium alcaliphilum (strain DSM 19304 / NCIMB 14124 / VKM B-2133 / 20Z) TaxID=1091494 RepID=G4T1I3_META2|nr:lysophospholipid acyltransferase family protein [Methylotuvimicrobium alcaliphilum]CCE22405.1 Phospholipid/glycerol acyltransferase [Methylotuvimicrobium alcaliphilum 20Z]